MRETVRQIRQRIALALQRFTLLRHFRVERGQRSRIGFLRQRFIGIRQISGQFRDGAVRSRQVVAQLCDGIGQILHRCRISLFGHCGIGGGQPVFQLGCPVAGRGQQITLLRHGGGQRVNRRRRGIRSILNLLRRCHISHMPVRNEPYGAIRAVLRDLQERADITPVYHRLRDLEAPGGSLPGRGR